MDFNVDQLDQFVLWGSAVTLLAILAVRVTSRAGLPSLLIYLLIGVALGEEGLGIQFEDAQVAHALGFAALIVILSEGGLTTPWVDVRPSMRLGATLATVGVAVSVGVMTLAGHYLLGLPWELAILLGAVTSPTDAAAVFSVLRVVPLPKRIQGVLEAESGLNDAPTVVLVTLVSTGAFADHGALGAGALIAYEIVAATVRAGGRLRRGLADAPRRSAGVRPLPPRRHHALLPRLRRRRGRARLRLRSRVRRRVGARQPGAARTARPPGRSPRAWPGWRRSGCS